MMKCQRCNLPMFDGAVGYAGPQCKCWWQRPAAAPLGPFVPNIVPTTGAWQPTFSPPDQSVTWREVVSDLLHAQVFHPSCQDGVVKRCLCAKCASRRARDALEATQSTYAPRLTPVGCGDGNTFAVG